MEAFFKHYDGDAEWHIKPEDAPNEIRCLEERKVETYPQGREACVKFMKKCQKKGWPFIVKVKRTKPAAYYLEIDANAAALTGDELGVFFKHYDGDAEWHIKPEDAPNEIRCLEERKVETYPQGREACVRFMRKCQKKGWPFVVKVKRTKPAAYYLEIDTTACVLSKEETKCFYQHYDCDAEWHIKPEDAPNEIRCLEERKVETYPQGREACVRFMRKCQKKGWPFVVKVKRTKPAAYYLEIDRTQIFNAFGLGAFYQHYDCDAEWHIKPEDAKNEIRCLRERKVETYPQGREECVKFMKRCRKIGQPFVVKVKRTKPAAYYLEVDK